MSEPVGSAAIRELAAQVQTVRQKVQAEVGRVVVGMEEVIERTSSSPCWPAATSCSKACPASPRRRSPRRSPASSACQYQRIQFTPDLLPSDVTGTYIFDRKTERVRAAQGADLLPGAAGRRDQPRPAKTQSALLEAMQENQVTIEGTTLPLPPPFMVLATQNPVEQEGVYRLPEAQLDRFLLRVEMGYPGHEAKWPC